MRFKYLETVDEIHDLIAWHNRHSDFVVLDFETTSKNPREAKLLDIQMSGRDEDEAVMFSGEHLLCLTVLESLQVFHNFKYDWKVAALHGVDLSDKPVRDTMLLHHLADENVEHGLDAIIQGAHGDDYKSRFWETYASYADAPRDAQLDYGCRDIVYTRRLYGEVCRRLQADGVPEALVEHTHRLALALYRTELAGIRVDLDYTIEMGSALKADITRTERELREMGGYHCENLELQAWAKEIEKVWTPKGKKWKTLPKPEFNFGASGQVAALLYDELGLPEQVDKKTKRRTADDKALEAVEHRHPIVPKIRELRKFSKMYGAFIEGVLGKVQAGRIYPSFNVNGTVTGRISHSEPNMGQMPSKGDWAKIRGIFIPEAGNKVLTCDYGQLEVCIAAHFSMDENLLRIIHEGASQHDITAQGLGIERSKAKTVNFSMQYGCTEFKIAEILGCSVPEGKDAIRKYWETYAGLKRFVDWCHKELEEGRPIANPFGRLRRFPKEYQNRWELEAAKRQVFSSLIQGTGADMTSRAFYLIDSQLRERGWGRGWFTVHDECLAEVSAEHAEEARELLQATMLGIGEEIELRVPLKVECSQPLDRWQK